MNGLIPSSEIISRNKKVPVCCLAWWYRLIRDASLAGRWGLGVRIPDATKSFFFLSSPIFEREFSVNDFL